MQGLIQGVPSNFNTNSSPLSKFLDQPLLCVPLLHALFKLLDKQLFIVQHMVRERQSL